MKISPLEFHSADEKWSFSLVSNMELLNALFEKTNRAKSFSAVKELGKPAGRWTIDEAAGDGLYEFSPGKAELTAEDLQSATNAVHEKLSASKYNVRGSLRFTLIFVKDVEDRFWVAATDSYDGGEGESIPWG